MFTGKEEHTVSLKKAQSLIRAYQKRKSIKSVKALYFGKTAIEKILKQKGCVGLRIYFGKKTSGADTLVLVGADKNGNDITEGPLAEFGFPCPPFCPSNDELMI